MKDRIDNILVDKGLFKSREKAKAAIMAGVVFVDGQKIDKAGTSIKKDSKFEVKEDTCPYVSRGGLKLEKAIIKWNLNLKEKIAMDMGSSTGGFTDCMLKNGANKVYSIDVGYGQLDYSLRINPKVVNMERTNIRYLDTDNFEKIDFISIDVSFISLELILPVAERVLEKEGYILCLVKPQFEAGREQVGKKGIVRDEKVHIQVLEKIVNKSIDLGLYPQNLDYSPITGAKGNIEYLLLLKKYENHFNCDIIKDTVARANKELVK